VPVRRTITPHEEIRRRCGFGVVALAQAVSYSHTYVSLVEAGRLKPSAKYRAAVSAALHVPEEVIFGAEREHV
jgi:transcriptional regulator with XRE-family HTH domain